MSFNYPSGAIDEARLWTTARTAAQISECRGQELGNNSGTCGRINDNLVTYIRFNEGEGHSITDLAGLGSGAKEYTIGDNVFGEWDTGWITTGPTLTPAD